MKSVLIQLLATCILSIMNINIGYILSWPSGAIEALESDESHIGRKTSPSESYLIASMVMGGAFMGPIFSTYFGGYIGNKRTEVLSGIGAVISWCTIVTARSVTQLLIGRLGCGFCVGLHMSVLLIYINELSHISLKGLLSSIPFFANNIGSLLSYVVSWQFGYKWLNYTGLIISVIFTILSCFLKKSPVQLLAEGNEKEALNSLKFYRGEKETTEAILTEFSYIRSLTKSDDDTLLREQTLEKCDEKTPYSETTEENKDLSGWELLWTTKAIRRTAILVILHLNLSLSMGMIAVIAFAGQLFTAAVPNMSPHVCSIILILTITIGSGLSTIVTNVVGRRILMMSSCLLSGACLVLLSSLIRWSWAPDWMIPIMILVYCFIFQNGANNIPFVQLSESFIPKVQKVMTCLVMCSAAVTNFFVLGLFGMCVTYMGIDGMFLLLAGMSVLTTVVVFFFMRETRGVPVEEIQAMHEHGFLYRRRK